jgi:hypothetical protein
MHVHHGHQQVSKASTAGLMRQLTQSTNKSLTSDVATLTTGTAHGFLAGQSVTVAGVDSTFNGTYTITAVPTPTTFRYAKTATDVSSTAVSPTGTVLRNRGYLAVSDFAYTRINNCIQRTR